MVSTHLKNFSQTGSFPQVGVKTKKRTVDGRNPPVDIVNILLLVGTKVTRKINGVTLGPL